MKLKLLIATAIMTVATAFSVSAMDDLTDTNLALTTSGQTNMLAVTPDAKITINISGVQGSLTLLSSKNGQEPKPDNIQYIRQYTPDANGNVEVTFQIRSIVSETTSGNIENGLYCVKLNDGAGSVKTLYYKVGAPVSDVAGTDVEYYQKIDFDRKDITGNEAVIGTTSVGYKATFTCNGGVVSEYGFKLSYEGANEQVLVEDITLEGEGAFSFGATVYGIPTESADAEIAKIDAVPFVNYDVDNGEADATSNEEV